jgi:hypothetical protein
LFVIVWSEIKLKKINRDGKSFIGEATELCNSFSFSLSVRIILGREYDDYYYDDDDIVLGSREREGKKSK